MDEVKNTNYVLLIILYGITLHEIRMTLHKLEYASFFSRTSETFKFNFGNMGRKLFIKYEFEDLYRT